MVLGPTPHASHRLTALAEYWAEGRTGFDRVSKFDGFGPEVYATFMGPAAENMCKVDQKPFVCRGHPRKLLPTGLGRGGNGKSKQPHGFCQGCHTLGQNQVWPLSDHYHHGAAWQAGPVLQPALLSILHCCSCLRTISLSKGC